MSLTPYLYTRGFSLSSTSPAQGMSLMLGAMIKEIQEVAGDAEDESVELFIAQMQLFILCEFARRYFDKRIDHFTMPRTWKTKVKKLYVLEATLLGETWKTIELLYSRSLIIPGTHPAETFRVIYNEAELMPVSLYSRPNESATATSLSKEVQAQNGALRKMGSEGCGIIPFDRQTSPATWAFVDQCRVMAGFNDDFKAQYDKMVAVRMSLTQHIRENSPRVTSKTNPGIERRGRKKVQGDVRK